jgi:D-proline reductase (dithiol) PrdB
MEASGIGEADMEVTTQRQDTPFSGEMISSTPSAAEIDGNLYLDFLTRKVMKGWMEREETPGDIPWTPLAKPLPECRVALVTSAGVCLRTDTPFDQEGERRDPWWGDPSYRLIPREARTGDVRLCHLHIDTSFGERDLNTVLPLERLAELEAAGEIGSIAQTHYSFMGYLLKPEEFLRKSVPPMIERMHAEGVDVALLAPV